MEEDNVGLTTAVPFGGSLGSLHHQPSSALRPLAEYMERPRSCLDDNGIADTGGVTVSGSRSTHSPLASNATTTARFRGSRCADALHGPGHPGRASWGFTGYPLRGYRRPSL